MIGRGWTQPGGRPHAETEALAARRARRRAARRSMRRSSPARITARRRPAPTPSSRPALRGWCRRSRIPIRKSRGRDMRRLRAAGIAVDIGVEAKEARARPCRAYPPHPRWPPACHAQARGLGRRQSRARRAAAGRDHRRDAANAHVHLMRAMHDAILIGIGTALSDDPVLTCRLAGHGRSARRSAWCSTAICGFRSQFASGDDRARDPGLGRRRAGCAAPRMKQALRDAGVEIIRARQRRGRPRSCRGVAAAWRTRASRG